MMLLAVIAYGIFCWSPWDKGHSEELEQGRFVALVIFAFLAVGAWVWIWDRVAKRKAK